MTTLLGSLPAGARAARRRWSSNLPIRNINRTVGTILSSEVTQALRRQRLRQGRHDPAQLPRHRRPEPVGLRRARRHGARRRRRERLLRQGTLRRQDHRLPAAREPRSWPRRTSSPATWCCTARPAASCYLRGIAGERFCVRNSGAHGGRRRRRRSRLRVHDRRPRGDPRPDGPQLRGRHERRHRLRARRARHVPAAGEQGNGRARRPLDRRRPRVHPADWSPSTSNTPAARAGQCVLDNWDELLGKFVKVMPTDYKRALARNCKKKPSADQLASRRPSCVEVARWVTSADS